MKPVHLALAMAVNLAWGMNFIAAKLAVDAMPPIWATALRFLIVAVLLAPFLRWQPGQMWRIFAISIFAGSLHFALMFTGVKLAGDVSSVAIAVQLGTPMSTAIAAIFLRERIGWRRISGIVMAFAGVAVLGFDPHAFDHLTALFFVIGAGLSMGTAQVFMRLLDRVPPFTLQAWIALPSTPALMALSWFFESGQVAATQAAGWLAWAAVAYTSIGSSIFGHGGMYYLLQRYPVSKAAPVLTLSPFFAVFLGVTLLGDDLTWRMVVGGLIAFAGVMLTVKPEHHDPA